MFRHVGEKFAYGEVRGAFDVRSGPFQQMHIEVYGNGAASSDFAQGWVEASVGEHRRVDATGQIAQFNDRFLCVCVGRIDDLAELFVTALSLEPPLCSAEVQRHRCQSSLSAIVKVSLYPLAFSFSCCDRQVAVVDSGVCSGGECVFVGAE